MTNDTNDRDVSTSAVPASPKVVPASGARPAPGADGVIGTYSAPNPGAQPGEVSDQPLVAGSAADPDPHPASKVHAPTGVTADEPNPEATAKGSTDPALHNTRLPIDATPVAGSSTVAAAVDPAASKMPTPQGPAQTQHSQHPGKHPPARR